MQRLIWYACCILSIIIAYAVYKCLLLDVSYVTNKNTLLYASTGTQAVLNRLKMRIEKVRRNAVSASRSI